MDTAGSERIAAALGSQAVQLSMQEEQLSSFGRGVQSLALHQNEFTATMTAQLGGLKNQIQQLVGAAQAERSEPSAQQLAPVPTLAHAGPELHLAPLERYSGEIRRCK